MSNELMELPEGWAWIKIEDIARVGTGATPLRSKAEYYESGTVPWVTSGLLNEPFISEVSEKITDLAVQETNAKVFPKYTLLVAMYGEGKTRGKVSELLIDAATNQACAGLVFEGITSTVRPYIKLFLEKNYDDIRRLSSGGVQPNLNLGIVKATELPIPPLNEQKRIVAQIEALRERSQKAKATLEAIPELCDRFRQSVLAAAFRGDLTADWREQNPDVEPAKESLIRIKGTQKYQTSVIIEETEVVNHPLLPESWCYVQIEMISEVFLGRQRSPKNHTGSNMRPYLRAANITWNGWDLSDVKEMNFDERDFKTGVWTKSVAIENEKTADKNCSTASVD